MASIGHVAVGMAAARFYGNKRLPGTWRARNTFTYACLFWGALSLLPDADVIGFRLGVHYADAWGHRGATHSFLFCAALACACGVVARALGYGAWKTALFASVVLISHPLLDTLTDGGLGCALYWPFDTQRHFADWRPIPVAPIGGRFFTRAGLRVASVELVLFAPFFLYALWPRRSHVHALRR